jgi:hypothetical protein
VARLSMHWHRNRGSIVLWLLVAIGVIAIVIGFYFSVFEPGDTINTLKPDRVLNTETP